MFDSKQINFDLLDRSVYFLYLCVMTTRDLLIKATSELIQKRGYHGTGMSAVIEAVGVPKGSLYHHFPEGKDDLISASLKYYAASKGEQFNLAMKGKKTAVGGLQAIVDLSLNFLEQTQYQKGCPVAAVSLDVSSDNEFIRKTCTRIFDAWKKNLESYLKYKNVNDPGSKAEAFMIGLQGSFLLSKIHRNKSYMKTFRKQIEKIVN